MSDCLFCKIAAGIIPSTKVYEDDQILAFRDIAPMAPTHILVIPKAHIGSVAELNGENCGVVAHIFEVIPAIARAEGLENGDVVAHIFRVIPGIAAAEGLENGYRVVSNCGPDAGQTVHHLHFHSLGGKELSLEMA